LKSYTKGTDNNYSDEYSAEYMFLNLTEDLIKKIKHLATLLTPSMIQVDFEIKEPHELAFFVDCEYVHHLIKTREPKLQERRNWGAILCVKEPVDLLDAEKFYEELEKKQAIGFGSEPVDAIRITENSTHVRFVYYGDETDTVTNLYDIKELEAILNSKDAIKLKLTYSRMCEAT